MSTPNIHIVGSKDDNYFIDAVGKPLAPGDVVVYPTARSSSVYMNFSVIAEIVPLDEPAVIIHGYRDKPTVKSWHRAFKLKVWTLDRDPMRSDVLLIPRKYDRAMEQWVPQSLDDVKVNTIHKVERVVKVEGVEVFDGPRR